MAAGPIRRFTLLDAMVLLAATGAGVAGMRDEWGELLRGKWFKRPEDGWDPSIVLRTIYDVGNLPLLCLVAWTFALLGLRFKQPRPRANLVIRQFGTAACAAAAVSWLLGVGLNLGGHVVARLMIRGEDIAPDGWWRVFQWATESTRLAAASSVLVAWMILAWGRRGRCEPSWIDRAGRATGVLWLLLCLNEFVETIWLKSIRLWH